MTQPTTIYAYVLPSPFKEWCVVGITLTEHGLRLIQQEYATIEDAKHGLGVGSNMQSALYRKTCPDGYTIEWIEPGQLLVHSGFLKAFERNREIARADGEDVDQWEKGEWREGLEDGESKEGIA